MENLSLFFQEYNKFLTDNNLTCLEAQLYNPDKLTKIYSNCFININLYYLWRKAVNAPNFTINNNKINWVVTENYFVFFQNDDVLHLYSNQGNIYSQLKIADIIALKSGYPVIDFTIRQIFNLNNELLMIQSSFFMDNRKTDAVVTIPLSEITKMTEETVENFNPFLISLYAIAQEDSFFVNNNKAYIYNKTPEINVLNFSSDLSIQKYCALFDEYISSKKIFCRLRENGLDISGVEKIYNFNDELIIKKTNDNAELYKFDINTGEIEAILKKNFQIESGYEPIQFNDELLLINNAAGQVKYLSRNIHNGMFLWKQIKI